MQYLTCVWLLLLCIIFSRVVYVVACFEISNLFMPSACSVVFDSLWPHGLYFCQAPLPMGFPRQENWSGLPFPTSHSFLWMDHKRIYHTFFFYPFISWWYCSSFWLLWIVLVWWFMYKFLFKCLFSVWGSKYLGVELLGQMMIPSLTFWGKESSSILKLLHHSLCPPATSKGSNFSICLSAFVIFLFLKKLL